MADKVIMPKQGLQMTEGIITKWIKEEGETVAAGEPLFEIETDKLNIEIPSPYSGVLIKILHGEGQTVPITETVAFIGKPSESISHEQKDPEPVVSSKTASRENIQVQKPVPQTVKPDKGRVFSTPRARTAAKEKNIDITKVKGTGPDGMIIERNILAYLPETPKTGVDIRVGISEHIKTRVDMQQTVIIKNKLKELGIEITCTDMMVKAAAKALGEFPEMNPVPEDDNIVTGKNTHIGICVVQDRELEFPAILDVYKLSLAEIADITREMRNKAEKGMLGPKEYGVSTFNVADFGLFEMDEFYPAINPPQRVILTAGSLEDVPVAVKGEVVIKPYITLSLTYDRGIISTSIAAGFLQRMKQLLQNLILLV